MLIDSHCHLDAAEFDRDRAAVVLRALEAGVDRIVVPGVEAASFTATAAVAHDFPICRVAFGIHPLYVGRTHAERDLAQLAHRLSRGDAVAVGEIGLDRHDGHPDFTAQESLFEEQLKLARRYDLPVLLHVRKAIDEVLKYLRRWPVVGGIAHAFNGSREQADRFIALGFKLGYGGATTYAGSQRIRRLAAELPLEAIVLETDAPDMPPEWGRGIRNEPANVRRYASLLAELRGLPEAELIAATGRNVVTVLPGV